MVTCPRSVVLLGFSGFLHHVKVQAPSHQHLQECVYKAIFFFYFLVYGSSDTKFCILENNKKFIFDFFYFLRCKKLPGLKKKYFQKKNNKNCMILQCKNAEMTILLSFLHFYSVKSYNFCCCFFLGSKYVSD